MTLSLAPRGHVGPAKTQCVLALHDRRVPGRGTNIDHIAVSRAGVHVMDTKNVAGKVSRTRNGLRVEGRRRDEMVTGVQAQIAVVRHTLDDQPLPPDAIHGVLCFTRAALPWLRPTPGGIALLNPRCLTGTLRKQGPRAPNKSTTWPRSSRGACLWLDHKRSGASYRRVPARLQARGLGVRSTVRI